MNILISQRAEDDLASIYAWLAVNHKPADAERFKERTEASLALLRQHPQAGAHPGWATRHHDLRFWVISRTHYIIYYELRNNAIAIERVLDGRRDVRRIMEQQAEY